MKKEASLEETEVIDPKTKKPIRVSTTVRLLYRKEFPEDYGDVRNVRLNLLIANDFADSANSVVHYFSLVPRENPDGTQQAPVGKGEIRGGSTFYYISAIKENSIDILTIQSSWLKPKYRVRAVAKETGKPAEGIE